MEHTSYHRALVIGAGHSGLAAAQALKAWNIDVTILEARGRVAEPWRARHPQLRLNIHRKFAELPGHPLTRKDGPFIRRDTVIDYIEGYAKHVGVPIKFDTSVERIHKTLGGWEVQTNRGVYLTEHLVIATGSQKTPDIPDWPGKDGFRGEFLHSAHLGDIRRFEGRKVLVIGAGNSGTDVLNHLAGIYAQKIWVSLRHGPAIIPTWLLGIPMHRMANVFARIPPRVLDRLLGLTQRIAYGDLSKYGMRSHPTGAATRMAVEGVTPALDNGFVRALKRGKIRVVEETKRFDGGAVVLKDGQVIDPDVVICATGYRSDLEPLLGDLDVLNDYGNPRRGMGQKDLRNPGLWFTGFGVTFQGYFHAARIAADRIADSIAASSQGAPKRPQAAKQLECLH